MKKQFSAWVVAALIALCCFTGYAAYDYGYREGESVGIEAGYDDGYSKGYKQGRRDFRIELESAISSSSGYSDSSPSSTNSDSKQSVTVYITKTGEKYHRYGCQYLKKSCISISLDDARARGYTACSRCW